MPSKNQLVDRCAQAIRSGGAKSVGLQYAAGFKTRAIEIAEALEHKVGVPVILSADASYGACDVREMPVDMVVHLGHAPIPSLHYKNVFFFEDPVPPPGSMEFVDKALPLLGKRVGLLTTTQFRSWLPRIREHLEERGHKVFIGKGGNRIAYEGQLIGCDYSAARAVEKEVDCFLYVGSGDFHPLAVAMMTPRPVIVADYERGEARDLDEQKEHAIRQRHGAIASAQSAQTFGIVVSTKLGQNRMGLAQNLAKLAKKHKRSAHVFAVDEVTQAALEGYKVDAWVNTACPRIVIEDSLLFKKPILSPQEFEIVLGERSWKDYELDEIRD